MSHINDCKLAVFERDLTKTGHIQDLEIEWVHAQHAGTPKAPQLNEAWAQYWDTLLIKDGAYNDRAWDFLNGQGATGGTLSDLWYDYWCRVKAVDSNNIKQYSLVVGRSTFYGIDGYHPGTANDLPIGSLNPATGFIPGSSVPNADIYTIYEVAANGDFTIALDGNAYLDNDTVWSSVYIVEKAALLTRANRDVFNPLGNTVGHPVTFWQFNAANVWVPGDVGQTFTLRFAANGANPIP